MALGASARTLFSLLVGVITLAVVALPAGAGNGDDAGPTCAGEPPTITGTNVPEWIVGTEGDDIIRAGAGADTISGLGGNDTICAGPGDDTSRGGQGDDRIRSGRGNDSSSGESGDDEMRGQGDNDLADGGTGIDACLFETHEQCEADLDVDLTGPASALTGGPEISIYNAKVTNHGPTPAVNSRVDIALPAGTSFVAASSDPRCQAHDASTVRCTFGPMGLELPDDADVGLTFADCDPRSPDLGAEAEDPRTIDHVPPNTTDAITTALSAAPVCNPLAVDDTATVAHGSGANTINVLANDIDNGPDPLVGGKTNGTNGTVAITNDGANVSYTPNSGYCGPDTFTYSLTPGGSTATVTVTVVCPTAVDDEVDEYFCGDGPITIAVLANDINPPSGGPFQISSVTQGTHPDADGTVTINPGNQSVTYEQMSFPGFNSYDDTFTYTISPGGSTATVTVHSFCEGSD